MANSGDRSNLPGSTSKDYFPFICIFIAFLSAAFSIRPVSFSTSTLPVCVDSSGHPLHVDSMLFCWNLRHIQQWIAGEQSLLLSSMIRYPFGADLTFHTLSVANGVIAAPLIHLWNICGAYNLLLLFHAMMTNLGVIAVAREVGCNRMTSIFAGMIAMLWPGRVVHNAAHLNIAGTTWIPLSIWCQLKILRTAKIRYGVANALTVVFTGLTAWQHLVSLVLMSWLPFDFKRLSGRAVLIWAGSWCIASMFFLQFTIPMWINTTRVVPRPLSESEQFSISPIGLVTPFSGHIPAISSSGIPYQTDMIETTGYLGIPILILFVSGIFIRSGLIGKWFSASVALIVLAMGPVITFGKTRVPMPFALLHQIPGMQFSRTPGRFIIPAGITVAIVIGLILSRTQWSYLKHRWIQIGIMSLILLDFLPPRLPVISSAVPKVYETLSAELPPNAAVLDIPCHRSIREYQYYQTMHGKPVNAGFISRFAPDDLRRESDLPFYKQLSQSFAVDTLLNASGEEVWDLFRILSVGAVVLHRNKLSNKTFDPERVAEKLNGHILRDDGCCVGIALENSVYSHGVRDPGIYYIDNWYYPENWQGLPGTVRWTRGRSASIRIFPGRPDNTGGKLSFDVFTMQSEECNQHMNVFRSRDQIFTWKPTAARSWVPISIPFSQPLSVAGETIRFEFSCAVCPADTGNSNDNRNLAAAFTNFEFKDR